MPILRPLMQQGEYLSGQNSKLLVRAEPATLQAITRIIKDLDRPLANLLITVSYDSQSQQISTGLEADVRVKNCRLISSYIGRWDVVADKKLGINQCA